MSLYYKTALLAQDQDMRLRLTACAAREGVTSPHPSVWVDMNAWVFAAQPGWAEDYAYALDTGVLNPGRAGDVISDGKILAGVQAVLGTQNQTPVSA